MFILFSGAISVEVIIRNIPLKLFRIQTSGSVGCGGNCVFIGAEQFCAIMVYFIMRNFSVNLFWIWASVFVCFLFDSLRPSQHFFSYVGKGLPVFNQY